MLGVPKAFTVRGNAGRLGFRASGHGAGAADCTNLPLEAIDLQTALEPPADLSPGHWVEPEQPAPGAPTGYVTLLAS